MCTFVVQNKMLKCAGNDDIITMKADDNGDSVQLNVGKWAECAHLAHQGPRTSGHARGPAEDRPAIMPLERPTTAQRAAVGMRSSRR